MLTNNKSQRHQNLYLSFALLRLREALRMCALLSTETFSMENFSSSLPAHKPSHTSYIVLFFAD